MLHRRRTRDASVFAEASFRQCIPHYNEVRRQRVGTLFVEVNSTLSGGTREQTIARAFMALLDSELGHSGPGIGAQAAAYARQEKSLAQLAIGPTQKALRSGDGVSTPILSNKCVGKRTIGGADPADQSQPPDND